VPTVDVVIDEEVVLALLAEQLPDLAALPLTDPVVGWDNVTYRLGSTLAVRLPRRFLSAPLLLREQRWLPELAPLLPLPIPAPIHIGHPGPGYPWSWSVCPWLPGGPAATNPPVDAHAAAETLGGFLRALHVPAPPDAPFNPLRGVPLSERDDAMRRGIELAADEIDVDAVLSLWSEVLAVPPWSGPKLWLHGDLHSANVLVHEGAVSAVIDFGDITSGDPAADLFVAWTVFARDARATFREAAGDVDDDTWARARGWALALAVAILAGSADFPVMQAVARRTLAAALTDA